MWYIKVFHKQWLAKFSNKCGTIGDEIIVSIVGDDQIEVQVRMLISQTFHIGTDMQGGRNALVCLAG